MKHKSKISKRIAAIAAAGTLLLTVPMSGCDFMGKENENSKADTSSQKNDNSGTDSNLGNDVAVKSEHYSLSFDEFQYFYNYNYTSFIGTYGSAIIDSSKDLSEQYYNEEEKTTWKDYFITSTKEYFTQIMVFAEAAQQAGLKLTEEDTKTLDDSFEQIKSMAEDEGKTVDEYFKQLYGDGITQKDVRAMQEMSTLGLKYRNQLYESYKNTEEEYEKEFNDNKTSYQVADYYLYTFAFASSESSESSETSTAVDEKTKNELKEYANALSNSKDEKEFKDYLTKYLKDNPELVHVETSGEESLTEDKLNSSINDTVEACAHLKSSYDDSTDTNKWIFDASRKAGDTKVNETEKGFEVVLVTKPIYRDESLTRSVRHILIDSSSVVSAGLAEDKSSVTDNQVKDYATKVYNEWTEKDTTEAKFAELANKYSTDPGSNTNGGLYTNVVEGQMVPTFNDWLFDKNRKQGDSGIVKTDYGYHIMYYVGTGLKSWQIRMESKLKEQKLTEDYDALKAKVKIDFNDEVINKVQITQTEESGSESSAANLANQ